MKLGFDPQITIYIGICVSIVALYARLKIISPLVNMKIMGYMNAVVFRIIPVVLIAFIPPFLIYCSLEGNFVRLLLTGAISVISVLTTIYYLGLNKSEKQFMNSKVKQLISKIKS